MAAASLLAGALGAALVARFAPDPAAEMGRGGEDAFVADLHPREVPPGGGPVRWTGPRARVRFRNLPEGPRALEVSLPGRREAVVVSVEGLVLGRLEPAQVRARFVLPERGRALDVLLAVRTYAAADGRQIGTLMERVRVERTRAFAPAPGLVAALGLAAAGAGFGAVLAGGGMLGGALAAFAGALAAVALLGPQGIAFSPFALPLAAAVAAAGVGSGLFARAAKPEGATGAGPALFAGAALTTVVLALVTMSPLLVVSDLQFQVHKLQQVRGGDLFPLSVTQHAEPFRFPYGIAFFALLAPLARVVEAPDLVRLGAAAAVVAGSLALLGALAAWGPRRAAAGVAVAVLCPVAVDVFASGNLANAFAQGATTALFAWWVARPPRREAWGLALAVLAALGHLSGAIVLFAWAVALNLVRGPVSVREGRAALLGGCALAAAYYATFAPLVVSQLGRLGEGGGQRPGLLAALGAQVALLVHDLGLPALVLAAFARLRPRESRLDHATASFLAAGAVLLLAAVVSPLEVRYRYALTIPLTVLVAAGAGQVWARGRAGQGLVLCLLGLQAVLGLANLVEALLVRYRAG